jgi:hypothetical protein
MLTTAAVAHPRRSGPVASVLVVVVLSVTACQPVKGGGGSRDRDSNPVCEIERPSAPYGIRGPSPDGANFYQFTSRAEGEVSCTGKVEQIGITLVFHYKTNGQQGALTGASRTCSDTRRCTGRADYRRQRLYCHEVYHYDDYAQVTAWFQPRRGAPSTTLRSKESRHRTGSSYKPRQAGCRDEG